MLERNKQAVAIYRKQNIFWLYRFAQSKMNFRPILIKDVLAISKEDLETLVLYDNARMFSLEKQLVVELPDTSATYTYQTELGIYKSGNDAEQLYASLKLTYDEDVYFSGNVSIDIKPANLSVKCEGMMKWPRYQEWYANNLCKLSDVLNPEKNFIIDGKLTLLVQGILFDEPAYVIYGTCLAKKLRERDDQDFIISVCKDNGPKTEIKIHKFVLMAWSPVFDRMIQTEMKEKSQNKVNIIDFDAEVVQAAVDYFYDLDTFRSLKFEQLIGLLHFVDKYQIEDAKEKVQILLLSYIYPNTVCQIANASMTSNSPALKSACIKTLKLYILGKVQFDHADALDKDFGSELLQSLSMPDEENASDVAMSEED